jgi:hypothetical protein
MSCGLKTDPNNYDSAGFDPRVAPPSNLRRSPKGLDKGKLLWYTIYIESEIALLTATTYTFGAMFLNNQSECCLSSFGAFKPI